MITVAGATANADSINSKELTKDFLIDGLGGNDTLTIDLSASNFQVKGGDDRDTIIAKGKVTDADKIKGGKADDALTFENSVTDSSVYGGKARYFDFENTVSGGLISGDAGGDIISFQKLETTIKAGEDSLSHDRLTSMTPAVQV